MRVGSVAFSLVAILSMWAAPAAAQPTLYVCTPTAQVLKVVVQAGGASTVEIVYTHPTAVVFNDCSFGPDGRIYILAATGIFRIDPNNPPESAEPVGGSLDFTPHGLAFNVSTLYVTGDITTGEVVTASKVYQLVGQNPADDGIAGNDDGPLTFPTASPTELFTVGSPARGVVFDYTGRMVIAAASALQTSTPGIPGPNTSILYTAVDDATLASATAPVGVGLNTCKKAVYADGSNIYAVGAQKAIVQFNKKDIVAYLEVGADNTIYAITRDVNSGDAKIWRAALGFATSNCSGAAPELLVELKNLLSGSGALDGLASAAATGIAVSPTNYSLKNTFTSKSGDCSKSYDFGLHRVTISFNSCGKFDAAGTEIEVTALRSTLSDVSFDLGAFAFPATNVAPQPPVEGMRYSPLNGQLMQYAYSVVSGTDPFASGPAPFQTVLWFKTQEFVAFPGVARALDHSPTAPYDQNVGDDYWMAKDDPGGARGDDISKRVMFNSGIGQACEITFGPPFNQGKPLFKRKQAVNIKLLAHELGSSAPCTGGRVRVSIYREGPGDTLILMQVRDTGNSTTLNFLNETSPGTYEINVDTSNTLTPYVPGIYWATFSGSIFGSTGTFPKQFEITK